MKKIINSNCARGLMFILLCVLTSVSAMAYDTWSVVGSKAIMNGSSDWALAETANELTTTDGVNYTLTVTGKTLEVGSTYEYKFAHEHAWNDDYTFPSANAQLTVTETAVYQIVYTINVTDKTYTVVPTKTGDAGEVTHTYSIAGSSTALFGGSKAWDEANTETEMTKGTDGVYTWTKEGVALSSDVTYKVLVDHSWGEAYPSSDATLSISGDATYNVTITFNPSTKEVTGTAEAQGTVTTNYYMKHPWNGGEWTWKQLAKDAGASTYSIVAQYGGNGCNYNTSADDSGSTWVGSPTLEGDPASGDWCLFTLNDGAVTISKNNVFEVKPTTVWTDGNGHVKMVYDCTDHTVNPTEVARLDRVTADSTFSVLNHQNNSNIKVSIINGGLQVTDAFYSASINGKTGDDALNVLKAMTLYYAFSVNGETKSSNSPRLNATVKADDTTTETGVYAINFDGISITTAVEDVTAAKTVAGVRYYNLAGVESAEPFEGVNIVVTRYTDGTTLSSKVMK